MLHGNWKTKVLKITKKQTRQNDCTWVKYIILERKLTKYYLCTLLTRLKRFCEWTKLHKTKQSKKGMQHALKKPKHADLKYIKTDQHAYSFFLNCEGVLAWTHKQIVLNMCMNALTFILKLKTNLNEQSQNTPQTCLTLKWIKNSIILIASKKMVWTNIQQIDINVLLIFFII